MENVIVFMICAALTIFGAMTLSNSFLSSVDASTTGLKEMEQREGDLIKTNLTFVSARQTAADTLEITIRNSGQTKLSDYSRWDVIVQYASTDSTTEVRWLPFEEGIARENKWTVQGIYLNATEASPEVFDPDIFNSSEEIVMGLKLMPPVEPDTINLVVVTAPNGTRVTGIFTGYRPD